MTYSHLILNFKSKMYAEKQIRIVQITYSSIKVAVGQNNKSVGLSTSYKY